MRIIPVILVAFFLIALPCGAAAVDTAMEEVGMKATSIGLSELGISAGNPNLLVMTDAGCVMYGNRTTEGALLGVEKKTGCSAGGGNLLVPQRSKFNQMWFFFFRKDTGMGVYLETSPDVASKTANEIKSLSKDVVFSKITSENVGMAYFDAHPEAFGALCGNKTFGGNEFTVASIANVWAAPGNSYEYLRAAQLHNHICPGLTSGYVMSKYIEKELPIESDKQSYKVISYPVCCKEDFFLTVWDATPGKRGLYSKHMTDMERAGIRAKTGKNPAGIFIRWDSSTNTGDGLVLSFDWDKTNEIAGTSDWKGNKLLGKMKTTLGMTSLLENPEEVVSTISSFTLKDQNGFNTLVGAGVNPLKALAVEV